MNRQCVSNSSAVAGSVLRSDNFRFCCVLFVGLSKLSMVESVGQPGRGGVQLHGSCGHALESELRTPKLSGHVDSAMLSQKNPNAACFGKLWQTQLALNKNVKRKICVSNTKMPSKKFAFRMSMTCNSKQLYATMNHATPSNSNANHATSVFLFNNRCKLFTSPMVDDINLPDPQVAADVPVGLNLCTLN